MLYQTDAELLAALQRLWAHPAFARELGEAGYRAFERHWSREAHLARYFELLRQAALKKFGYIPWQDSVARRLEPPSSRKVQVSGGRDAAMSCVSLPWSWC